jgi:hypothetical protein
MKYQLPRLEAEGRVVDFRRAYAEGWGAAEPGSIY